MAVRKYGAIPLTTEMEPETEQETAIPRTMETEPETEPEAETDTEPEPETDTEPPIYVNIRDFGLSMRIRLFICVIFYICLSVYFLDVWHFLYLPTHSRMKRIL